MTMTIFSHINDMSYSMSNTSFSCLHSSHMHCIFHIYFGLFNLVIISFEISQKKNFTFLCIKNKHNESLCTSMIDFTIIGIKMLNA